METVNPPFVGFTIEELTAICHHAGCCEQSALEAAAEALYPGRLTADPPAKLKVETGLHGRIFRREVNGEEVGEVPAFTIKSQPLNWIGVMADGTVLPY